MSFAPVASTQHPRESFTPVASTQHASQYRVSLHGTNKLCSLPRRTTYTLFYLQQDDDLLLDILDHLKLADLVNTMRVSRRWKNLSHELISRLWPLLSSVLDFCERSLILNATRLEFPKGNFRDNSGAFNDVCTALAKGAFAQLTVFSLSLWGNQIGDAGIIALAQVIKPVSEGGSGAMASLKQIAVDTKHMRHPGLVAACQPRGIEIL